MTSSTVVSLRRRLRVLESRLDAFEEILESTSRPRAIVTPRSRRKAKRPGFEWNGDWNALPATLNAHHMAAIEGVTVDCIWDRIQRRTMRPKPVRWMRPYRWDRSVVQAERAR